MPPQYRHRGMFRRGTQPALHPEPRISYFATVPQNAGGLWVSEDALNEYNATDTTSVNHKPCDASLQTREILFYFLETKTKIC